MMLDSETLVQTNYLKNSMIENNNLMCLGLEQNAHLRLKISISFCDLDLELEVTLGQTHLSVKHLVVLICINIHDDDNIRNNYDKINLNMGKHMTMIIFSIL